MKTTTTLCIFLVYTFINIVYPDANESKERNAALSSNSQNVGIHRLGDLIAASKSAVASGHAVRDVDKKGVKVRSGNHWYHQNGVKHHRGAYRADGYWGPSSNSHNGQGVYEGAYRADGYWGPRSNSHNGNGGLVGVHVDYGDNGLPGGKNGVGRRARDYWYRVDSVGGGKGSGRGYWSNGFDILNYGGIKSPPGDGDWLKRDENVGNGGITELWLNKRRNVGGITKSLYGLIKSSGSDITSGFVQFSFNQKPNNGASKLKRKPIFGPYKIFQDKNVPMHDNLDAVNPTSSYYKLIQNSNVLSDNNKENVPEDDSVVALSLKTPYYKVIQDSTVNKDHIRGRKEEEDVQHILNSLEKMVDNF